MTGTRLTKILLFHLAPPTVFFLLSAASVGTWSLWLLTGLLAAALVFDFDHLLFSFVAAPQEAVSQQVKLQFARRDFPAMVNLIIDKRHQFDRLTLHNVGFQLLLVMMAMYAVSSSGSWFAKGFATGLLLHSVIDQAGDFVRMGNINSWFWIAGQVSPSAQKMYYAAMVSILLLILFLI